MSRLDLWVPTSLAALLLLVWHFFPGLPQPGWLLQPFAAEVILVLFVLLQFGLIQAMWRQQFWLRQRVDKASLARDQALLQIERMQFDQRRASTVTKQAQKDRLLREELLLWHSHDLQRLLDQLASRAAAHPPEVRECLLRWQQLAGQVRLLAEFEPLQQPAQECDLHVAWQQFFQGLDKGQQQRLQWQSLDEQLMVVWPPAWVEQLLPALYGYCRALAQMQPASLQFVGFIHAELGEVIRIELRTDRRLSDKELHRGLRYTLFVRPQGQCSQPDIDLALAFIGQILSKAEGLLVSEQDCLVLLIPKRPLLSE